jgi:type II secretory pathway predicted ATPase ExeA/pSer/pThr/pTyr-binding forkhead associated (FHA) protein
MQAKLSWLGEQAFGADVGDLVTMNYKSHRDALLFLQSVLSDQKSVGFLRGPMVSGKSTILRRLSRTLPGDVAIALVDGASMQPRELLSGILAGFGYDTGLDDVDELLQMVEVFAVQQTRSNQAPILIVDNVDLMHQSTLRILNALAEVTLQNRHAIRIIMTGCERLSSLIETGDMDAISNRVVGNFVIGPLSPAETLIYLHARVAACGVNSAETVFPVDVCDRLYQQSGGWPGLLNQFAAQAIARAHTFPLSVDDTCAQDEVTDDTAADRPAPGASKATAPFPPRLVITRDGDTMGEYTFNQRKVLIGRSGFADVVIDDNFVSKLHAVMLLYSDALVLFDLSSANGTTVNSVRVKSTILKENDIISLGNHRVKVRNAPAISDEMASLLESKDTVEMKSLVEMRRLRERRHALVSAQRKKRR